MIFLLMAHSFLAQDFLLKVHLQFDPKKGKSGIWEMEACQSGLLTDKPETKSKQTIYVGRHCGRMSPIIIFFIWAKILIFGQISIF